MAGRKGKSLVVRRSFPFRPAFLLLSGREKGGCGGSRIHRPKEPGRRGQFFRPAVHLPRRVIFPGKTLSTFVKTILTLEKTVSTLENSVSTFVFSPTGGGGRTAGGKNGILLFPNRLNPFRRCMEGLCGPCRPGAAADARRMSGGKGPDALFSRYYTCLSPFLSIFCPFRYL